MKGTRQGEKGKGKRYDQDEHDQWNLTGRDPWSEQQQKGEQDTKTNANDWADYYEKQGQGGSSSGSESGRKWGQKWDRESGTDKSVKQDWN